MLAKLGAALDIHLRTTKGSAWGKIASHLNGDRQGSNRGLNQFVIYAGFSISSNGFDKNTTSARHARLLT